MNVAPGSSFPPHCPHNYNVFSLLKFPPKEKKTAKKGVELDYQYPRNTALVGDPTPPTSLPT